MTQAVITAADALLARADVQVLLAAFAAAGAPARIVGGAVRDVVMGREPGDIDIATPLLPDDVISLAKREGWKAVPTGIDHGTVTLVLGGRPYEVTTLRRDVQTDGRRAVVAFTEDWREDAFRRDFTLNALSLSADGRVHDHANGVEDARSGIIRFMGDAETRIREDYLRVLRFFRFMASHGRGAPEPAGLAACARLAPGLSGISRERVRQELLKLLVAPGALAAVTTMAANGLWPHVLPGASVDEAAFARWVGLADVVPDGDHPVAALVVLAGDVAVSLKLSKAETAVLSLVLAHEALVAKAVDHPHLIREAVYKVGVEGFPAVFRAACARQRIAPSAARAARRAMQPVLADPPVNPFRSADAARHGIPSGPRMGQVLKAAEADWIAQGLPADPQVARRILAAVARN
jgi:poly(A) polymerase